MKKLFIVLLLIVGAITFVPSQAEARDRHYRSYDRCDYDRGYSSYRYSRPNYRQSYYRSAPVYYAPRYTSYYAQRPVYYSRPRSSFSFSFSR